MKTIPVLLLLMLLVSAGCATAPRGEELADMTAAHLDEPEWIRNGEPIIFEAVEWFPTDEVENLLGSEVYAAGTFRGLPFFIEKTDVRPFERLYTRFAVNRYRAYEQ